MDDRARGTLFALLAFSCWGLFPLYFKLVSSVPTIEMAAHRTFWVMVSILPVILFLGWSKRVFAIFKDRRVLRSVLWSTFVLTLNWLIFIWAMANGHVLQSSLAYYISPLINVLLGVMMLGERLRRVQWVCVGLAGFGVGVMMIALGQLPWIALSLAITFGLYGLLRKQAPVDAITGLFVETMFIAPIALLYLVWLSLDGRATLSLESGSLLYLVVASGAITAIPLILFAAGAKRLPLSLLGFFQYIIPTGHFVLAVFVFDELFTRWHLLSFALIWTALAIYTAEALRNRQINRPDSDS